MTAEKPSAYARGRAFYYATLNQAAYQECMLSLGYHKLREDELNRERLAAAARPSIEFDAVRKMCERVMGIDGEIQSCVRYMSMDSRSVVPAGGFGHAYAAEAVTGSEDGHTTVCLRKSTEPKNWKMTASLRCGEQQRID